MTRASSPRRPLRLWPGMVAGLMLVLVFGVPLVNPDAGMFGVLGALVAALGIAAWWLFFSRAPWFERIGAILVMIVALVATRPLLDKSVAGAGMGILFYMYAIIGMSLALVAWAVTTSRLGDRVRRVSLVITMLLASGAWTLVRTGGIAGGGGSDFHWRWTPTAEDRLLAQSGEESTTSAAAPASVAPNESIAPDRSDAAGRRDGLGEFTIEPVKWPGFRGPDRDDVIRGVRIETDWSHSPPVELWRKPIGPGWSSFAVAGDVLYTQEQRGDDEVVACYRMSTGMPVWKHRDRVRFWESNGGAGPRATPALAGGRVYTLGATGIVNALDARNGSVVWSRNAAADTGAPVPTWGFAGSPLVVGDLVIVAASGRLAGYDRDTGHARWARPTLGDGYSSPHLVTIDGVPQVLLLSGGGITSVAPADGIVLWEHSWQPGGVNIVQPAIVDNGDILLTAADAMGGVGMRRIHVEHTASGWGAAERWTSRGLKPYFNDFVVHKGHAFGFDGSILSCIDLQTGDRTWKGGRFGNGQLVLLPDQDVLIVLSEEGELALVGATPDRFTEIARVPALEGKTWNHAVLAGDVLLVRNGEYMAAFRLGLARR